MKKFQMVFYSFFLLFNSLYVIYNVVMGFDWSQVLLPLIFVIFCGFSLRSVMKEHQQSK